MHIVLVDNSGPIPASSYGGTQRVVWALGKSLHALGHQVSLLGQAGSDVPWGTCYILDLGKSIASQLPPKVDVAHLHFIPTSPVDVPYVITLHGQPGAAEVAHPNSIFISKNHAQRHGCTRYVHNGLDWDQYPLDTQSLKSSHTRNRLHFMAKARWKVKNLKGAVKIANKASLPLDVMGGSQYEWGIMKRNPKAILSSKVKFHGMLNDTQKMQVMKSSKALLFPVTWHEPFGLAVIESMYAGCAAFGSTQGSLPELITPEVGAVADKPKELAQAILDFDYSPERVHEIAKTKYSAMAMTLNYLKEYERVMKE